MKHPWRRRAGCSALCQSFHAPPTPTLTRPTPSRLLSQPEFDSPTEEILWSLSKALEEGDVGKITDAILIKVARQCNPEGILRETFIQEEIATKYAEYGYGDLKSDVEEKTGGALKQLLMALLSDRLDYESQILEKAMKGLGTDEDCLITILCTLDEEDIFPLQQAYSDRYERSLEQAVISETSGKFKRVLLLAGCDSIDEAYAKVCHSAISGMGTDCKALIRLMVTCPHEVMDKTREAYSRLYGNDLVSDMGGEWAIGGDFKRILCALAKKHPERIVEEPDYAADVATLRDAVEGLGTDEEAIIDVLSNKTFDQIEELKEAYKVEHGELLKERIKAETTGLFESEGFRNTLMGLLTKREEQIAFYLKEAFEGWFANDDWGLISMLVHRTESEMREIRNAYTQVHGSDLIADIRKNCGGDYEKALVALVAPRARTIARGIKACMSGWISSTNKGSLIALLTHRDAEMKFIRDAFEKEARKSLISFIKKECSGEFEKALVSLASYTAPVGIKSRIDSGEETAPSAAPPPAPDPAAPPPPAPAPGYGYGAPAPGYGYGAPPPGYSAPPGYGPPPGGGYPAGYGQAGYARGSSSSSSSSSDEEEE